MLHKSERNNANLGYWTLMYYNTGHVTASSIPNRENIFPKKYECLRCKIQKYKFAMVCVRVCVCVHTQFSPLWLIKTSYVIHYRGFIYNQYVDN